MILYLGMRCTRMPFFIGGEQIQITTRKMTLSAIVIALYLAVMFLTQSFAFGQFQIRIATALYALAFLFPFLVVPFGLANLLSNLLFGGLGLPDMIGGCLVGMVTAYSMVILRRRGMHHWWTFLPTALVPSVGVSLYLSWLFQVPYGILVMSLAVGQSISALVGVWLVGSLERQHIGEELYDTWMPREAQSR